MVGRTISHYKIVEKLGEGGMGVVYKARDSHLDRFVALKVLPPEKVADPERKRRFVQEAKAASALNHPNIVTVHDIDQEDGVDFIAMEYVEGRTLDEKIGRKGLKLNEALKYAIQIADALAKAHAAGIVHRDLKPGNVMVTGDGRVKVLDFGLAKLTETAVRPEDETKTAQASTEVGMIVGTASYMSPEQAEGKKVDARSDIFSFGSLLYEMLTGRRPFRRDTPVLTLAAILHMEPPPLPAGMPHDLEKVVARCLRKDPAHRFQHMDDLRVALEELEEDSDSGQLSSVNKLKTKRPWRWASAAGVAAVVLMLATVLIWQWRARMPLRMESLLVLPVKDFSGGPSQEYFTEGMTDGLIAGLAQIKALNKVISRYTAMQYKDTSETPPQIAKKLGVDGIVHTTVMRSGGQVRITVHLIEARQDRELWAKSYEREMTDILALQSEVVQAIAGEIRAQVTPQESARFKTARRVDPEVYEVYLKGRFFVNKWTEEGLKKGIEYFQQAASLDPAYAPAYAGLADGYSTMAYWGFRRPQEALPLAKAAAVKALELDQTLAEAHAALGIIKFQFDWDWSGAEQELKRAIELSPSSSVAHSGYSTFLVIMGRSNDSVTEARRASELDPLTPTLSLQVGFALYYARRHDEAIAQLRKTLELDQNLTLANAQIGWNYAEKRMYPEALAECRKAIERQPEDQLILASCGRVYGLAGKRNDALDLLARLKRMSEQRRVDPYSIAWLCDGLKDNDLTIGWLERAYKERSSVYFLKCEVFSDSLRSDPRFQDLLRRMNFPP
jgi:serine/threonine protein kinase/tetratricopeptide (TPR) repeat protein